MADMIDVSGLDVNLDQYFGLWAVEPSRFMTMFSMVTGKDLKAHISAAAGTDPGKVKTSTDKGISIIDILGTMTKRGSSLSSAGSTVRVRQEIRRAANDPNIGAILLRVESPGGTVSGTADLGAEVAAAAAKKPVYGFAEDLCASAGYWAVSQCTKVFANDKTAMVGSIGTFVGLYDVSGMAAMQGIKAVVISSGGMKGAGFPGTEITSEQKAEWQKIIDDTQAEFTAAVSRGRKMSATKVAELADGRVHLAADALSLGLIDGIMSFDAVVASLRSEMAGGSRRSGAKKMSEANDTAPKPASYHEIVGACPGADAAFIVSQLGANVTADQARAAWMTEQNKRIAAANEAAAKARADADQARADAAAAKTKPGVPPVPSSGKDGATEAFDGDPEAAWHEAVNAKIRAGMSRPNAVKAVARSNPQLQAAYVEQANARPRSRTAN